MHCTSTRSSTAVSADRILCRYPSPIQTSSSRFSSSLSLSLSLLHSLALLLRPSSRRLRFLRPSSYAGQSFADPAAPRMDGNRGGVSLTGGRRSRGLFMASRRNVCVLVHRRNSRTSSRPGMLCSLAYQRTLGTFIGGRMYPRTRYVWFKCISSHLRLTTALSSPSLETTTSAAFDALQDGVSGLRSSSAGEVHSPPLCPLVNGEAQPEREQRDGEADDKCEHSLRDLLQH